MIFRETVDEFIGELRAAGLDIAPGEVRDCYCALGCIDWLQEPVFYQTLATTLVKDYEWLSIFKELFHIYFNYSTSRIPDIYPQESISSPVLPGYNPSSRMGSGKKPDQDPGIRSNHSQQKRSGINRKRNNLLELDFYTAAYQTPIEDIRRMESLIPLMGRRMAAKMKLRRRRDQRARYDFRRTIRHSMNYGGIPVELLTQRKVKEKPVIFVLCDISRSCLYFSYFSLAIVHILETYFRQVRSFAFIDEADEITDVVKKTPINTLRQQVMNTANACTDGSYTNYGRALETFVDKYGKDLNHKSTVVIFGDARTNWFPTKSGVLRDIQGQVKRVYWFNPERKEEWQNGDSSMDSYAKYCQAAFECCNLDQLADAITKII